MDQLVRKIFVSAKTEYNFGLQNKISSNYLKLIFVYVVDIRVELMIYVWSENIRV